jgi:hypothetical protein
MQDLYNQKQKLKLLALKSRPAVISTETRKTLTTVPIPCLLLMVYRSITDFKKKNVRFPRTKDLYKKIQKNLAPRSSVRQP